MTTFPTLTFPGLGPKEQGWSTHRRPTFSTRVASAVSGREVTAPYYVVPLYEFELTYDQLYSGYLWNAMAPQTLQLLQGFFLALQGQYGSFLFTDPDFNTMRRAACGTGNGSTVAFPLLRVVGIYTELVQLAAVQAVYLNGVVQPPSAYSVVNGNALTFATAPAASALVTADFTYQFVCRFLDDVHDYEEFMHQLHTLKSCKFRSRRTS